MYAELTRNLDHSDILMASTLAVAAEQHMPVKVMKVDSSTIRVLLPNGIRVTSTEWDNIYSALVGA